MAADADARQQLSGPAWAAALLNGPLEFAEFIIPIWASSALGGSPAQVGAVLAVFSIAALATRRLAGRTSDKHPSQTVAALGAGGLALGFVGYSTAGTLPHVLLAAGLAGVSSSFFWVGLRAFVARNSARPGQDFAHLMSWEETGAWVAFLAGLSVLNSAGYPGVFLAAAGCAAAGCAVLLGTRARTDPDGSAPETGAHARPSHRGLFSATIVLVHGAEALMGLALLIHLQSRFGLELGQIALVYLPGAIALGVLPGVMQRIPQRFGFAGAMTGAAILSALFAVAMAFGTAPVHLGIAWVLQAAALSLLIPAQQALIAENEPRSAHGRAFGTFEAWVLAGVAAGSLVGGVVYQAGGWVLCCVVAAAASVACALAAPRAVAKFTATKAA